MGVWEALELLNTLREYETAVETAKETLLLYPAHPFVNIWLAAALGQLGRQDEARDAWWHVHGRRTGARVASGPGR